MQSIAGVWKTFSPNQPIRYSFLDESYSRMYDDVRRMEKVFIYFASLAILVACLGLYALSSFMVEQRHREISIRLVLGPRSTASSGCLLLISSPWSAFRSSWQCPFLCT